jgi:hypothetical protein
LHELYCVDLVEAYVTQESISLRICCEKKGMFCVRPMDVCMKNLWKKAEWGKKTSTESRTRVQQVSCFKKTCDVCQKYGGACTTYYLRVPKV